MATRISDSGLVAAIRRAMVAGCKIIPSGEGDGVTIVGIGWALKADSMALLPPKTAALLLGAAGRMSDVPVTIYNKEPPQTMIAEDAAKMVEAVFDDDEDLIKVSRLPLVYKDQRLCLTERLDVYAYDPALLRIVGSDLSGEGVYTTPTGKLVIVAYGISLRIMPMQMGASATPLFAAISRLDWRE